MASGQSEGRQVCEVCMRQPQTFTCTHMETHTHTPTLTLTRRTHYTQLKINTNLPPGPGLVKDIFQGDWKNPT